MNEKIEEMRKNLEKELIAKYKMKPHEPFVIFNKYKEMVECQLLMEAMEAFGAPEEELKNLLSYMVVVADADKERLNWLGAYNDFGIDGFVEKYLPNKVEE